MNALRFVTKTDNNELNIDVDVTDEMLNIVYIYVDKYWTDI